MKSNITVELEKDDLFKVLAKYTLELTGKTMGWVKYEIVDKDGHVIPEARVFKAECITNYEILK